MEFMKHGRTEGIRNHFKTKEMIESTNKRNLVVLPGDNTVNSGYHRSGNLQATIL